MIQQRVVCPPIWRVQDALRLPGVPHDLVPAQKSDLTRFLGEAAASDERDPAHSTNSTIAFFCVTAKITSRPKSTAGIGPRTLSIRRSRISASTLASFSPP